MGAMAELRGIGGIGGLGAVANVGSCCPGTGVGIGRVLGAVGVRHLVAFRTRPGIARGLVLKGLYGAKMRRSPSMNPADHVDRSGAVECGWSCTEALLEPKSPMTGTVSPERCRMGDNHRYRDCTPGPGAPARFRPIVYWTTWLCHTPVSATRPNITTPGFSRRSFLKITLRKPRPSADPVIFKALRR
jgi:hypothetical protein